MQGFKTWLEASARMVAVTVCALTLVLPPAPQAATVADLYTAEVTVPGDELAAIFRAALAQVVVRVTGSREVATPDKLSALGDPAALVLQYRSAGPGTWQVGFDPTALRQRLDAAGLTIWSEERPATLLWLAVDSGRGEREILAGDAESPPATPGGLAPADPDALAATRESLLQVADVRGLPLVLPLVDTADLQVLSFADLWGDFSEPVLEASARYQADAVLIGRTPTLDPAAPRVRWTLLFDGERWDWEGTLADGPEFTADLYADRLATSADSARQMRVAVRNLGDLDAYGQVYTYLQQLSPVERCDVEEVTGDRAIFQLTVRGDPDQLLRIVALRRLLVPVDEPAGDADLQFAFVAGP